MTRAQLLRKLRQGLHPKNLPGSVKLPGGSERQWIYIVGNWVIKPQLARERPEHVEYSNQSYKPHKESLAELRRLGVPYVRTYAANDWLVQPLLGDITRDQFYKLGLDIAYQHSVLGLDIGYYNVGVDSTGKVWAFDY